jgi:SAM-dependent methyltransferase
MEIPLCPLTKEPAIRLVQWVSTGLLRDLWRIEFGVDAAPSFGSLKRFGLWESPTGLYFFYPLTEGDHAFYATFYKRMERLGLFPQAARRAEFSAAAKMIEPGARVLDIGCRTGEFRYLVPQAHYTGLDPNFTSSEAEVDIRAETLEAHLLNAAGHYDAVCAFQVLEHLNAPAAFFQHIVAAAKPGGHIFIGVPHVPSAMTRIPNFLINAPPHHLTWWTRRALETLAQDARVEIISIESMPWTKIDSIIYWIEYFSIVKCKDIHFKGAWSWHAANAIALLFGQIVNRLKKPPAAQGEGTGLLLVARRPA